MSSLMELVNELYAFSEGTAHGAPSRAEAPPGRVERAQTIAALKEAIEALVVMISPFAPHMAEELWQRLGHARLWSAPWPAAAASMLVRETVELVLQVNGKVRDRIEVPVGLPEAELIARGLASEKVQAHLNGKEPRAFPRAAAGRRRMLTVATIACLGEHYSSTPEAVTSTSGRCSVSRTRRGVLVVHALSVKTTMPQPN